MAKATTPKTGTGKRKEAIARVELKSGKGDIFVNGKKVGEYFGKIARIEKKLKTAFEITGSLNQFDTYVNVVGGGSIGQADAVMYGIAKALMVVDPANRKALKAAGLVKRDSRIKERKKYGRPGARKRYQYSKR